MKTDGKEIFTIGHSDHSEESFLNLLRKYEISVVADVRSIPVSRFTQYAEKELKRILKVAGIRYVFLGKELGARRDEEDCYEGDKAKYSLIKDLPLFRRGIDRLLKGIGEHRIAVMCAERHPKDCHRAVLVCRELKEADSGIEIKHILYNGEILTHDEFEESLRKLHGLNNNKNNLFDSNSAYAYERQSEKIAYTREAET